MVQTHTQNYTQTHTHKEEELIKYDIRKAYDYVWIKTRCRTYYTALSHVNHVVLMLANRITKCSIVIWFPVCLFATYVIVAHAITWVSNYSCPISNFWNQTAVIGYINAAHALKWVLNCLSSVSKLIKILCPHLYASTPSADLKFTPWIMIVLHSVQLLLLIFTKLMKSMRWDNSKLSSTLRPGQ